VLIPIINLEEVRNPLEGAVRGVEVNGDLIHEYTYSITEQLFDSLGENWTYKL